MKTRTTTQEGRQDIKTGIYQDNSRGGYVIMVPVYYEHETSPAWRKVYRGTRAECETALKDYPESMKATPEENARNRKWKRAEAEFLQSTGKAARAQAIRRQYHF